MSFWENLCTHRECSEPDGDGEAVCLRCGMVVTARLTEDLFLRTLELVRRDQWHSMACVDTPEGWCCASDCPSVR